MLAHDRPAAEISAQMSAERAHDTCHATAPAKYSHATVKEGLGNNFAHPDFGRARYRIPRLDKPVLSILNWNR
jgi:hypothetical protein